MEAKSPWGESCPILTQGLSACSSVGNILASKAKNLEGAWWGVWFQVSFSFCQESYETFGSHPESMAGITNHSWHREDK